jgi:glycosyltransferase involved in cell wall biosynthesis
MRRFYQRCDTIVAPSESMAEVLRDQQMNDDIGVWPSGVDQDVFSPAARCLKWRRSLGIADDEIVIGFLGRLVMEKGLDVFCDTIEELKRRNISARVLVVGDGPAREWFAKRLPHAVFVGFQTGVDLGRAVASMDIFLNPSVTETFGIVTLEAMSSGVAVIGADAAGTASLVADGVTGRLICSPSGSKFADAIESYIADPVQRAAAGAAGRYVASDFSWDAVNRTLVANYLRAINRRACRQLKGGLQSA